MEAIDGAEREVVEMLRPMFPNLSEDDVNTSVLHFKNKGSQLDEATLFERCLNDLLETVAARDENAR